MHRKVETFKQSMGLSPVPWDLGLSEDDLISKTPPREVLFGRIPFKQVLADLEARGMADNLRERGYQSWDPEVEYPSLFEAHFRLWGHHPGSSQRGLLMDVRTQRGEFEVDGRMVQVLVWEWVSLQDPMASFPPGQQPLPGQDHPGLGQFRVLMSLMLGYASKLDVEALAAVPEYFHNAVLYAGTFRFYDPVREGRFQALRRDLLDRGLCEASWAVCRQQVQERQGDGPWFNPHDLWVPGAQVHPLTPQVEQHFLSPSYQETLARTQEGASYRLCSE